VIAATAQAGRPLTGVLSLDNDHGIGLNLSEAAAILVTRVGT
jgi:hypothetical protein